MPQNKTFKIGGMELNYLEPDPSTERRFEVPLLAHFIQRTDKEEFIEVGAVSCKYLLTYHQIFDPTDDAATKEFAENLDYVGKNVMSVSTIEHIGKAEYGLRATSPYRAITTLNKMLEAKTYLITWPIGYNLLLDHYATTVVTRLNDKNILTLNRDDHNNWKVTNPRKFDFKYGQPYPHGNAVIVITNLKELLTK
jgi:hypothetical protein